MIALSGVMWWVAVVLSCSACVCIVWPLWRLSSGPEEAQNHEDSDDDKNSRDTNDTDHEQLSLQHKKDQLVQRYMEGYDQLIHQQISAKQWQTLKQGLEEEYQCLLLAIDHH